MAVVTTTEQRLTRLEEQATRIETVLEKVIAAGRMTNREAQALYGEVFGEPSRR